MRASCSEPVFRPRRHASQDHIGGAIPGYLGRVPGGGRGDLGGAVHAVPAAHAVSRVPEASQPQRRSSAASCCGSSASSRSVSSVYISDYPAAGDRSWSRGPLSHGDKAKFNTALGLTSLAREGLGGASVHQGFGSAAKGIPGYQGYVPGKHAENVCSETWSRGNEKSVHAHLAACSGAPKSKPVFVQGNTLVHGTRQQHLREIPVKNPGYQDRFGGWSACELTGSQVDPAGRMAPHNRQEGYDARPPRPATITVAAPIPGFGGHFVGRGRDNFSERQQRTASHLYC